MKTNAVDGTARLGRLVRAKRQELNLTQDDVAAAANVSRNTLTQLELGNTRAPKTLPRILAALGLDIADLLIDIPVVYETPPGSAPPLAHLSDAQLGNETMRLLAELTARLAARPTAVAVPPPGALGTLSAVDPETEHPDVGH